MLKNLPVNLEEITDLVSSMDHFVELNDALDDFLNKTLLKELENILYVFFPVVSEIRQILLLDRFIGGNGKSKLVENH